MHHGPGEHLPRGGILGVQPAGRGRFPRAGLQPRGGLPGHPERVPGQGRLGLLLLARLGELPGPVGAQRLQHHIPEPAIRPGLRRGQQRAVHQMQHRRARARPGVGLGGLQREGPREHRHHPEYPPLVLIEQLVAPLHRGGQRLLPRRRRPVPVGQQREPVTDPVQQLRHAQRLHPGGGQLDRQRHSVQPRHQPRHRRRRLAGQRELRNRAAGPVGEQRHRLGPGRLSQVIGIGQGQRRQPVPGLPGHPQRLPAGRQHPHLIAGGQQPGAQLRGRAGHVLAVIQHQQQLLPGQHPGQRRGRRKAGLLPHAQRRRHHGRHQDRVAHRGQLGQPHPVREPARHLFRDLAGQPGLARPARPGHRHQPVPVQQGSDLADSPDPAHEAGQRGHEAVQAPGRGQRLTRRLA